MGKKMRQKRRNIKRGGRMFAQIPKVPVPHAHTKHWKAGYDEENEIIFGALISPLSLLF